MEISAARITGFETHLGARLSFEVEGGGKASASSVVALSKDVEGSGVCDLSLHHLLFGSPPFSLADEQSADEALNFSLDEPLSIPVLARSAPMIVKLNSSHSLLFARTDAGSTALWLNQIACAEGEVEVQLPLDS